MAAVADRAPPVNYESNMSTDSTHTPVPDQFRDIAPYDDTQFKEKMQAMVKEPGFEHAIRYIMPNVDYDAFVKRLLSIQTQHDFQSGIMHEFLNTLEKLSTDGVTSSGTENIAPDKNYTFITNHRDIVLDASFLNLVMLRNNLPITQVAIGNNLLIYEWITDLVKLNRSFIVKRDVRKLEALDAARQLSAYIHFTITTRHESVWIAQREGRAKDSNDRTQESLMKMLSLGGNEDTKTNLEQINLLPVAICYEFDPNDYLKATEFLRKRRDPEYKKSQRDDLFSMETGLLGYKGRVHFSIGKCINDKLADCPCENRAEAVRTACQLVDSEIHRGYHLFPINYLAYDRLEGTQAFADRYTAEDVAKIDAYLNGQLDKVELTDVTPDEREYMLQMMLTMYANPVRNQIAAQNVMSL